MTQPARRLTPVAATPVPPIPRMSWEEVQRILDPMWIPKEAPHHSIIGLTGSGKSYFTTRALLPMVHHDKVLIIDNKGDDPVLRGYGKPVKSLPHPVLISLTERKKERRPRDLWYRLVVTPEWKPAREQVKAALAQVWKGGGWFVVVDECKALTDPSEPGLNLRPVVEQLWTRGRSRQISVIAMTQSPSWVPSSFFNQPSFVWIGRINDEEKQKRLREVGGLSKAHLPLIAGLRKREFLLVAEGGDFMAITGVKSGS